jgi:hypothetical protein
VVARARADVDDAQGAARAAAITLARTRRGPLVADLILAAALLTVAILAAIAIAKLMPESITAYITGGFYRNLLGPEAGDRYSLRHAEDTALAIAAAIVVGPVLVVVPTRGSISTGFKLALVGTEALFALGFACLRLSGSWSYQAASYGAFELALGLVATLGSVGAAGTLASHAAARRAHRDARHAAASSDRARVDAEAALAQAHERLAIQYHGVQQREDEDADRARLAELADSTARLAYRLAISELYAQLAANPPEPVIDYSAGWTTRRPAGGLPS